MMRYLNCRHDHGYVKYTCGCRCEICTEAKRVFVAARRAAGRAGLALRSFRHGTCNGYVNFMCRCELCRGWRRAKTAREAIARSQKVAS